MRRFSLGLGVISGKEKVSAEGSLSGHFFLPVYLGSMGLEPEGK